MISRERLNGLLELAKLIADTPLSSDNSNYKGDVDFMEDLTNISIKDVKKARALIGWTTS
jgi:hypothetical protein